MITALQIAAFLGFLVLLSAILQALDVILDTKDRDVIRTRVLNFWLTTADVGFYDKLRRALRSRYDRMRSLRFRFLKLFWILASLVIVFAGIEYLWGGSKELAGSYRKLISFDFGERQLIHFHYVIANTSDYFVTTDSSCEPNNDFQWLTELADYGRHERAFQGLISALEEQSPALLLISAIVSDAIDVIFLLIPLSCALLLSFNVTMWVLSKVTNSHMRFVFILAVDLGIAIAAPPVITSLMLILFVALSVFTFGQVLDFTTLQANWFTLTLGTSLVWMDFSFLLPIILALIVYTTPLPAQVIIGPVALFHAMTDMVYDRIFGFVSEASKFMRFDFSTDVINATIDFAIFTDLLFSLAYLLPCLGLILANRSPLTRRLFLNVIQWIADHPKGPLIAISEMLTSFATYIRKLFSGS